jgi:hypothetical protein
MSDVRKEIKRIIHKTKKNLMTEEEAVSRLLYEMGRGGRTLVVDENVSDLYVALDKLNYTVKDVPLHLTDEAIKKSGILKGRVFITENGQHFNDPKEMKKYYYGLVWVKARGTARDRAKKIGAALKENNFSDNLLQVVKV